MADNANDSTKPADPPVLVWPLYFLRGYLGHDRLHHDYHDTFASALDTAREWEALDIGYEFQIRRDQSSRFHPENNGDRVVLVESKTWKR